MNVEIFISKEKRRECHFNFELLKQAKVGGINEGTINKKIWEWVLLPKGRMRKGCC